MSAWRPPIRQPRAESVWNPSPGELTGDLSATGQKPLIMKGLPGDRLANEQYFRGYLGLSSLRLLELKEIFPAVDGAAGTYVDHAMILLGYGGESEAAERLRDMTGRMKSDGRFSEFVQRDQLVKATDRRNQVICAQAGRVHI